MSETVIKLILFVPAVTRTCSLHNGRLCLLLLENLWIDAYPCISDFSVARLKHHGHKQVMGEFIGSVNSRGSEVHCGGQVQQQTAGLVAGVERQELIPSSQETTSRVRCTLKNPRPGDILPPARPNLPKQCRQLSLWESFLIHYSTFSLPCVCSYI